MQKQILLVVNSLRDPDYCQAKRAIAAMQQQQIKIYAFCELIDALPQYPIKNVDQICLEELDAALILGGDGTLLSTVRRMNWAKLPLLAINLGHLGYLTQGGPEILAEAVQRLADGNYHHEDRIYLHGKVARNGKDIFTFNGLNEVSLHRGDLDHMIHYTISVNGHPIDDPVADGVIVSTPTGSTAYNLSAGGPILVPTAKSLIITAICAHSMSNRPIVTSPEDTIQLTINSEQSPKLIVDSLDRFNLQQGDTVTVSAPGWHIKLIRWGEDSFYQVLRNKLYERA